MYLNNLLKENTHKQDSIVEAEPGLKGGTTTTPSGIITPVDMNTKPAKPLSAWEKLKQQTADKFKTPKNAPLTGSGSVFNTNRIDTPDKPKIDVNNTIDNKAPAGPAGKELTRMQKIRPFTRTLGAGFGILGGLHAYDQAKQGETLNAIGSGAVAAGGTAAAIAPNEFKRLGNKAKANTFINKAANKLGVRSGLAAFGKGVAVDQGIKTYQALDKYLTGGQDNRDLADAVRHAASAFGYGSNNGYAALATIIAGDPELDPLRLYLLNLVGAEGMADWLKKIQPSDSVMKEALEFENWADEMTATVPESVVTEAQFDEAAGEKDACYHKVKSRYKVWPSAYASGALVQCRKKGADNWGNSKKKSNENVEMDSKLDVDKLLTSLRNSKTTNSDRLADAIEMRFMHNMTFKEIGEELNVGPSRAAMIIEKALRLLRWHAARSPGS
jgi:hypothetical protein